MTPPTRIVALIPARAGSKRVVHKNVRVLGGHPLLGWTVSAAKTSGVFAEVIVSTDSEQYSSCARHYGADVPFMRPADFARDMSPDIEWIEHALAWLRDQGRPADAFSLLRPTSPFRKPETIRRAYDRFVSADGADSLRAVQRVKEHPGKMWVVRGERMMPLLPYGPAAQPWHSSATQSLPAVFVQNASLEMAWSRVVHEGRTIAGEVIVPFVTEGDEGFDVNTEDDWVLAEHRLRSGAASLPALATVPWSGGDYG